MTSLNQKSLSFSQRLIISLVETYQRIKPGMDQVLISVFGSFSDCKHRPTCSEYTIRQIREHGTIAGVARGIARILSCR